MHPASSEGAGSKGTCWGDWCALQRRLDMELEIGGRRRQGCWFPELWFGAVVYLVGGGRATLTTWTSRGRGRAYQDGGYKVLLMAGVRGWCGGPRTGLRGSGSSCIPDPELCCHHLLAGLCPGRLFGHGVMGGRFILFPQALAPFTQRI